MVLLQMIFWKCVHDSIGAESYAYVGKFFYIFVGDDRDVHVDGKHYVVYFTGLARLQIFCGVEALFFLKNFLH